jgi:hypothetical protein
MIIERRGLYLRMLTYFHTVEVHSSYLCEQRMDFDVIVYQRF